MPETGITKKHRLTFTRRHARRAAKKTSQGEPADLPSGRLPRVARLMALAIRFDRLLETGTVADQTELAELGHVTRARVTQIMNMLYLAPDIQESILHLPRVSEGRAPIVERHIRPMVAEPEWAKQRPLWHGVASRT